MLQADDTLPADSDLRPRRDPVALWKKIQVLPFSQLRARVAVSLYTLIFGVGELVGATLVNVLVGAIRVGAPVVVGETERVEELL